MELVFIISFLMGMGLCWLSLLVMPIWVGWLSSVLLLFILELLTAISYQREVSRDRVFWFLMGSLTPIYGILLLAA